MRTLPGLLLLALLCAPARAAGDYYGEGYRTGKFEFGVSPGWAIPSGKTGNIMGTSWAMDVHGGYQFEDYATVGIDWAWQFRHKVHGTTTPGDFGGDFNGEGVQDETPFNSTIHYTFMNLSPFLKAGPWFEAFGYHWRPFAVAGAGLYHEWSNSGTVTVLGNDKITGVKNGPFIFQRATSSNSYLGINFGGGFDVQIDDNASLGFDLRYERIFRPFFDFQFIVPTVKIIYLF